MKEDKLYFGPAVQPEQSVVLHQNQGDSSFSLHVSLNACVGIFIKRWTENLQMARNNEISGKRKILLAVFDILKVNLRASLFTFLNSG